MTLDPMFEKPEFKTLPDYYKEAVSKEIQNRANQVVWTLNLHDVLTDKLKLMIDKIIRGKHV